MEKTVDTNQNTATTIFWNTASFNQGPIIFILNKENHPAKIYEVIFINFFF
ncbi:hypothetical protein LMIV_2747 [Listeria monocytogenes FSL J1-208]|nr:hypothetical protein LMIV_2747 [Listeria monocytogenes FSL J1-208]